MSNGLSQFQKRLIMLLFHSVLVPVALYLAYVLRFEALIPTPHLDGKLPLFVAVSLTAPLVFIITRLHRVEPTATDRAAVLRLTVTAVGLGVLCWGIGLTYGNGGVPRSVPIVFAALFLVGALVGRKAIVALSRSTRAGGDGLPVAIYGTGSAARQLVAALHRGNDMRPVVFVEDRRAYQGALISGLRVVSPETLRKMVADQKIKRVMVALPSLSETQLRQRLASLSDLACDVQVLPSYAAFIADQSASRVPANADQILGQTPLPLDGEDIAATYGGRVVMVTGAGGTAGRDLCQALMACAPARIVLFDQSETALFALERAISAEAAAKGIELAPRLGHITFRPRAASVIREEGVEIILHLASHKNHAVTERNALEVAHTNVLGTHILATAAVEAGVLRMVSVSAATAPGAKSVAGITSRMAEHVLQDLGHRQTGTVFSILRTGHVLGATGSILALIQKQIKEGGPVRLPHPEATRLFLGRNQAARLAVLAGAHGRGGDVLCTDAVSPVRLTDVAERLIGAAGGDPVEILYSGLRPGEPLHEPRPGSGGPVTGTSHPKLLHLDAPRLSEIEVAALLQDLRGAVDEGDYTRVRAAFASFLREDARLQDTARHG